MEKNLPTTKSRILDASLRLFAAGGYDKVSMRDIADAVGILSGSLYHHFESKEQLLQACYDFHTEHRLETRLVKEQYEPIILNGTKEEVIQALNYEYSETIVINMILSLHIMLSRIYIDEKAKDMFANEINSSMQYLTEFFEAGIKLGRFDAFNVPAVSLIYLSARLFAAESVCLRPEQKDEWRKAEVEMFAELVRIIPFKY